MDTKRIEYLFEQRLRKWGRRICFYLPGMFWLDNKRGLYPAISITGYECKLGCEHCKGALLKDMLCARDSNELIKTGERLYREGIKGILLSGGCNEDGEIPFEKVIEGIAYLKKNTSLYISIHSGMRLKREMAKELKEAGVNQALIDVIGDDRTMREIYKLDGVETIKDSIEAIIEAGLEFVPHIVIGIDRGRIRGEYRAVDLIRRYNPKLVCLVVLMPDVRMKGVSPPPLEEVLNVLLYTREELPETEVSLGCARPRGEYRYRLEELAIESGVTRVALWSERAIEKAKRLGLEIEFYYTCCSVDNTLSVPQP